MKSSVRNVVGESLQRALSLNDAARLFDEHFRGSDRILVAVSGGADSMALLDLLCAWGGASLEAATVDHVLRAESATEAERVSRYCRDRGVTHATLTWHHDPVINGLQQRAREARYRLLCQHAAERGLTCLTTAHHADDQAETVMMRLASGSGLAGLAGMRQRSYKKTTDGSPFLHVRPFLEIAKERLVMACNERQIPFAEDPSNSNAKFARARYRAMASLLEAEGLTTERLGRLAHRIAQADDALDACAEAVLRTNPALEKGSRTHFPWSIVAKEPSDIRLRVLAKLIQNHGSTDKWLKLERLEALLKAIDAAFSMRVFLRRSFAHAIITLSRDGCLSVGTAPPRKRGRAGTKHTREPVEAGMARLLKHPSP